MDEIPLAGFTTLPPTSLKSGVPRIAEAAVQMECTLTHQHELTNDAGEVTATLCVVRVQKLHVNKAVYDAASGVVDLERLRPVSRLGGDTYGLTKETFELPPPMPDGTMRTEPRER